jgi:hypothetical protein
MGRVLAGLLALVLIAAIVVILALPPFVIIWALNALFTLSIPFTVKTWFAAAVLLVALTARGWK